MPGELSDLEESGARIKERVHPIPREQLATSDVALARTLITTERLLRHQRREIRRQRAMVLSIRDECRVRRAHRAKIAMPSLRGRDSSPIPTPLNRSKGSDPLFKG